MTDKLRALIQTYAELIPDGAGFKAQEHDGSAIVSSEVAQLNHARWMLDQMAVPTDKLKDQAAMNRWLGFVQGVLWSQRLVTIDTLREQTRGLKTESPLGQRVCGCKSPRHSTCANVPIGVFCAHCYDHCRGEKAP